MSINDNISSGTGPLFPGESSHSNSSYTSSDKSSQVTLEFSAPALVRFQFHGAAKKLVLEVDKIAFEKQLSLMGYKWSF